jgi:hypothetical protein
VLQGSDALNQALARPPDVIDLDRQPAQGRDVARFLHGRKAARAVPLAVAGGEEAKVARARKVLPDASYASWRGIRGAVRKAGASGPELALLFAGSQKELQRRLPGASRAVEDGPGQGWVDYKICAIDETWSGLCSARRKRS